MKELRWNAVKSERLKKTRGVSFEEIVASELVAVKEHPKKSHQSIMLFWYRRYIWVVPFIEAKDHIFLKTIFASRKYTKIYMRGHHEES